MKTIYLFFTLLFLTGCHSLSYNQQVEDGSYIQFQGNYIGSEVTLGENSFSLNEKTQSYDFNGQEVVKYQAPTGKSLLVVKKNNETVIQKYIFLSEGQTLEVTIP